jgi:hypothetical protein
MTDTRSVWRRTRARVVAGGMTIALASAPLAAAAADSTAPAAVNLKAAIEKAATKERLASSPTERAQTAQQGTNMAPESKSFFKTPLGLAVIAIVGSGTAYALYSAQHDRIHSEVRQ